MRRIYNRHFIIEYADTGSNPPWLWKICVGTTTPLQQNMCKHGRNVHRGHYIGSGNQTGSEFTRLTLRAFKLI